MDIARLGSHPLPAGTEIENTAIKPPSPGTPRETGSSETSEASGANESTSVHLSKRPIDDPALKSLLSEKLDGGSAYSGPQIRMDRNIIGDDGDDGGGGGGPDAPSGDGWGVSKSEDPKSLNSNDGNLPKSGDDDNNGPTRGVGFGFTGRPGREGDGHTSPSGSTGTSSGSSSTTSSSTSSSSSSSSSSSGTSSSTVHPQKK
jgi:hypothetical protein